MVGGEELMYDESDEVENDADDLDDEDFRDEVTEGESNDLDCKILHNLALFFLQLQVVSGVPVSAIQNIIDALHNLLSLSQPLAYRTIAETLQSHGIDQKVAVKVASGLKNDMPLEKYTRKDSILYTQMKRLAYYRSNLPYVQPEELVLGQRNGKEKTYVYVPVLQVMQKLLNRTDYISHFSKEKTCAEDVYSSYRDSIFCQTNQLFSEDENALMRALYNDDWETVNPLGTSRKKHKLSAFCWTLVNLPSQYRAQLSAIQMAILASSDDVM